MARVVCPFCLKPHDFMSSLVCPNYQEAVPAVYVRDYDIVPPLWLVTIGFTQHGKTTYLAALTLMLEAIPTVWRGVHYRPLDQYTTDRIREMRREATLGKLPGATPKQELSRPLLFNVHSLPQSGSRCLVMYDVSGEIYNSLDEVQDYVPSIKQVNTTWFLVSLPDLLDDQEGKTVTDLFNVYLSGMENLRVDLSGRNLIVVYTKGDEAVFPRAFRDYLRADPFKGLTREDVHIPDFEDFSLHDYVGEMKGISDRLEDYTRDHIRGGAAFINMVKANGMNLVFCLTSSLGESPDPDNRLRVDAFRYRVLDPFLWAITLEKPISPELIGLVVDASQGSRPAYDEGLLPAVWERLSDYGELTTYHLGQTSPASYPGQRPPESPPRLARQRLIGPILEQASPDTRFIILATGPIVDLADFYNSPWRDRVLLVMVEENHQQEWPNTIIYRPGDAPAVLVDRLLRLRERRKRV
jgi:hypothetical protein